VISRDRARAIGESAALAHRLGSGVHDVQDASQATGRLNIYNRPDLSRCWLAYVDAPFVGLVSAVVILIDKETGAVLYAGSANDEG
jgi:hypothetical protein